MLYLLVVGGAVLYLLFSLNDALALPQFRWLIFFKQNIIPVIINLIVGFLLVYAKDSQFLVDHFPINGFVAILLGFSGQTLFKKLSKAASPDQETKFGINR